MALTLIKEDGTGMATANSYADVADGDSYHDGHLYASAWSAATADSKAKALVMATRVIDAMFRFNGFKRLGTQALQWPRMECRDPDSVGGWVPDLLLVRGLFLDEFKVPALVMQATCELGRELLVTDRTAVEMPEGLKSMRIEGALKIDYQPTIRPPVVPVLVQNMLAKVGEYLGQTSGPVRLIRT
jgi:hypothetical protein